MDDKLPPSTHNMPPAEDAEAIALQKLIADTRLESADIIARYEELVAGEARAPAITDDTSCGQVGDYIKLVQKLIKRAEVKHDDLKAPWLARGRVIDAAFNQLIDPLKKIKERQLAKITTYGRAKEQAERNRRIAELAAQQERERLDRVEAQRIADAAAAVEAQKPGSHTAGMLLEHAVEAEGRADLAAQELPALQAAVNVKPADLARVRGAASVSTLQQRWVGEIIDLDKVDLEALRPFLKVEAIEAALTQFVRVNQGRRQVAGCLIEQRSFGRV